jgi:hypothetical protein
MLVGSARGIPFHGHWNTMHGEIPTQTMLSNLGSHSMMPQQMQLTYAIQGHVFYQKPSQESNFS